VYSRSVGLREMFMRRGAAKRRKTSFQVVAVIWIVVAVGVICTIYFAPKKPPAPPASTLNYEERPERPQPVDDGEPDRIPPPWKNRAPVGKAPKKEVPPEVEEPGESYLIQGVVTDAKTGDPIVKARVSFRWKPAPGASNTTERPSEPVALAVDSTGAPPASSEARPVPPAARKPYVTYTNREGQYAMEVAQEGMYAFEVTQNGYISIRNKEGVLDGATGKLRMDFTLSRGASISGRVVESGTSKGAEGIKVRSLGGERSEAVTDREGKYRLTGFVPGAYEVRLDLSSAPYTSSGMVPTKNVTVVNENQEITGINFQVDAAGVVWGNVLTMKKEEPVPGTDVLLCTNSSMISQLTEASITKAPPLHGRSDQDGYYEIVGVPLQKEWRLYATTKERAPQLTAPFVLTPSQRSVRINIYVRPGTTVYGRVVSTDRSPIEGAEVVCIPNYSKFFSPFDTPRAFRNVKSGEEGSFEVPHLPVGEYQVLAQKDGYKFAATGTPVYPDGYSDIRGVEVMLTPVASGEFSVYGTVMDGQGRGIEGAKLALASMGIDEISAGALEVTSDSDGKYVFAGVSPGLLMLVVEKTGYQSQTVSNVRLDEPTDVVLEANSMVSGTVLVRETGEPAPTFSVQSVMLGAQGSTRPMLAQMLGGAVGQTFTETQGHFTLALAPGDYILEARSVGLTPGRAEVSVEVGEDLDDVEIFLSQAGARMEGRVVTRGGAGPQGALVWLGNNPAAAAPGPGAMASGVEQEGVQVGEDGSFEFLNLTADTYYVFARLTGYAQGMTGPILLGEGQTESGVTVELGLGNSLQGYVAFDGRLAVGAIVLVAGLDNGVTEMTTSDEQGRYQIDQLPAGSYLASAVRIGGGGTVAGLFSPVHARVEIVEGETTVHNFGEPTDTALVGLITPRPPLGTIGYALLHLPGVPIDIATLNLANPMSLLGDASTMANFVVSLSPIERDGYFRMDNLAEGEYQILILYTEIGDILRAGAGGVRVVYSDTVMITNGQTSELAIQVLN